MATVDDIIDGMAARIWYEAYGQYLAKRMGRSSPPSRRYPAPPAAASKAALDLEQLYQAVNQQSLGALFASEKEAYARWNIGRADPNQFGRDLAMRALGTATPHGFETCIRFPVFHVTFDGSDLAWHGEHDAGVAQARNPPRNPPRDPHDVPHVKTVAEVRRLLAKVTPCDSQCPGWGIFNEQEGRPEIQVCDECMTSLQKSHRLSDDDVAQLAEAQKALREAQARTLEENPARNPPPVVGDRVASKYGTGTLKATYASRHDRSAVLATIIDEVDGEEIKNIPVGELVRVGRGRPPGVPNR